MKTSQAARAIPAWEWPTYGHDAQHTFHGLTTLTSATVGKLQPAWFFKTGDAVTATPTVVNGTVYAGSWDGNFYAVDLETGRMLWKYALKAQHAVTPYPGEPQRDVSSDGGLVTSSAWYQPASYGLPPMVIFGGGYTLYALDAETGKLVWDHDYPGRPEAPLGPNKDGTRIFSSPVVSGDKVLFGVDVDGQSGERGYIAAASLTTGAPVWEFQTDVNSRGTVLNDGCGSVWSSGTILPAAGLVVFDTADCHFSNPPPMAEVVLALDISTGRLVWKFRPSATDNMCDRDFGATPNAGIGSNGQATFLGVGSKNGTYYSLDPNTGKELWATNVVFGGFSGGFIASSAYDGHTVVGATALGDFGRFEKGSAVFCDPSNPRDTKFQEPSDHAFDAADGQVLWQSDSSASFGATTIAGGMSFDCLALSKALEVRQVSDGKLLETAGIPNVCWSGVATVGDSLILGVGSSASGDPAGIVALTPGGTHPTTP